MEARDHGDLSRQIAVAADAAGECQASGKTGGAATENEQK